MKFADESEAEFNRELYLRRNTDVAAAGADPWEHWRDYGWSEERLGLRRSWRAPHFAEAYYRGIYPDARARVDAGEYASGAEHWFLRGRREVREGQRRVPREFDEEAYLARREDVAASVRAGVFINAFDHWLQDGFAEGIPPPRPAAVPAGPEGTNLPPRLTSEKAQFWLQNGYVILEEAIDAARCEAINDRIHRLWVERRTNAPPIAIDVYLERPDSRRLRMKDAPGDARALPYKINDMVMHDEVVRAVALDPDVASVLRWVLDADPVAIGSLNFERGSTQAFHTDTLYMPGKDGTGMTAAWFALEDVTSEAGPLLYYPSSHDIPLFLFSTGEPAAILGEMDNYRAYMADNVAWRGLVPEEFLPKRGDVLIWHERLFHGGKAIGDMAQTRRSLVVHYWRADHMADRKLVAAHGGYYWDREPL